MPWLIAAGLGLIVIIASSDSKDKDRQTAADAMQNAVDNNYDCDVKTTSTTTCGTTSTTTTTEIHLKAPRD